MRLDRRGIMAKITFTAKLGAKGRVSVVGAANGFPIRTSVFPTGDGGHSMMVNEAMQKGAGAVPGDTVTIVLEPETKPRRVAVPKDLRAGLAKAPAAAEFFDGLAHSLKKAYVSWIKEAKRPGTRAPRVAETIERLAAGRKDLK